MSIASSSLITAEQFWQMPDMGPCELVKGRVVSVSPPGWRHGRIAIRIGQLLENYLDGNDIGRTSGLDTGVVTERDPDTVRGADLCYHSYARLPVELDPADYPAVSPEIIWEVRSPSDRWTKVLGKAHEYLEADVLVVCIVDPERQCFVTYYPDRPDETLPLGAVWTEPTILPGFELSVEKVFRQGRK